MEPKPKAPAARPAPKPTSKPALAPKATVAPAEPVKVAGVYLPGDRYAAMKATKSAAAEAPAAKVTKKSGGGAKAKKAEAKKSAANATKKKAKKKKQSNPLSLPVFLALCYLGYTFVSDEEED